MLVRVADANNVGAGQMRVVEVEGNFVLGKTRGWGGGSRSR